jgi:hypothetical protein
VALCGGVARELDHPLREVGEELLRRLAHGLADAPRESVRRARVDPQQVLVLVEVVEERVDQGQDALAAVRDREDLALDRLADGLGGRPDDGLEQTLLALEHRVDGRERDLGLGGDVRDLGAVESLVGELRRGCGEHVGAPQGDLVLPALCASRVRSGSWSHGFSKRNRDYSSHNSADWCNFPSPCRREPERSRAPRPARLDAERRP